jgi:hypothetical protein
MRFFPVDTVFVRRYHVLFVVEAKRRVVNLLGIAPDTNDPREVTQVSCNFCCELEGAGRQVSYLIRDRDARFTTSFDNVFASIGVGTILAPGHSPKANAMG